jgi:hypothetical protein
MGQRFTATTGLVERVMAAFDQAEIRWALLRGRAGLGVAGRDMDLLVDGDEVGAMEDALFALGGVGLPRRMHPWHRNYVLENRDAGGRVTLDVVSQLIYNRRLQIRSGLETACLDRRRRDGAVSVLDPTDLFWTVLLHCLLDKQSVNERRSLELENALQQVCRPSPGEEFFEALCPPGWSADRALASVASRDWQALVGLGRQFSSEPLPAPRSTSPGAPRSDPASAQVRRRALGVVAPPRIARTAARHIYPLAWRRAGLGVVPHILDVVESVSVDAIMVSLRRRPGVHELVILIPDERTHPLLLAMRQHDYWRAAGRWNRVTSVGIERVHLISPSQLSLSIPAWQDIRLSSTPMPGRLSCRRASAGAALLVAASTAATAQHGRGGAGPPLTASSRAWAEAERLAGKHGLRSQLELLTADSRA